MSLVPGDDGILKALYEYRYLTSGQLARRTRRSTQVIRRAIRRRLVPGGLVVALHRRCTEEAAFALGAQGVKFIADNLGCPVAEVPFPPPSPARGLFWQHFMLINDIRISLDIATEDASSPICVERTIPEWETRPGARRNTAASHHERFVLSERLKDADGTTYYHRPDCCFLVHPKAIGPEQRVAIFMEADRGTEAVKSRIRAKMEAFYVYWYRRLFFKAFGAVGMRVLFVLDDITDRRRIHSMQDELRRFARTKGDGGEGFRRCFRFALKRDLNETTVLAQAIFYDADDEARFFFAQPVQNAGKPGKEEPARASCLVGQPLRARDVVEGGVA